MVKITADLISRSSQFLNPVKEFQLDLRGYKITAIENLSATNDQFGCIDISDNSIVKVESLPKLNRLRTLLLINNRISKIEPDFALNCPYLENLILTNNKVSFLLTIIKISNITEIDNIATCKSIVRFSLIDNLVSKVRFLFKFKMKYYRLYVIFKLPGVRVLDFQKVKLKERIAAKELFTSEKGIKIIESMSSKKFLIEEDEEYLKSIQKIQQDENKKKMIYVCLKSITFRI